MDNALLALRIVFNVITLTLAKNVKLAFIYKMEAAAFLNAEMVGMEMMLHQHANNAFMVARFVHKLA